jgi:hypothetical protein
MDWDFNNMPKLNLNPTIDLLDSINREQQESLKAMGKCMKREENEKHKLYKQP